VAVRKSPSVIAYHAVGDCADDPYGLFVSKSDFEKQMAFLARRREVVPLDVVVAGEGFRGPTVAITFDDGYRNNLTVAAPILRRFGLPASVFVATGWLGRKIEWMDVPVGDDYEIMTSDELREIHELVLSVESHGHSHIDMSAASPVATADDLSRSREVFEEVLGRPPRFLAYPWGRHSPAAQRAAQNLGFRAAFSIDQPGGGQFARSRVTVNPLDGKMIFRLKTSGYFEPVRQSKLVAAPIGVIGTLRRRKAGQRT
jgi:peptidoglycan/xylan/chitin deacetylase (PgdA/CDA1 family)